jgi:hypothetical protein
MQHSRRLALSACLLSAALCGFAQAKPAQVISVSDAAQFAAALGPDRTIVLAKGDYSWAGAKGVANDYLSWGGEDGAELLISGLQNLTLRGSDGARLLSDSSRSPLIGLSDSRNVTIDNLRFVHVSLHAESVAGLTLDRCSFEGPQATALELWECSQVSIRRCGIQGAVAGALSVSYARGLELRATKISGCEGYPLLYDEGSEGVSFKDSSFEGNRGGSFIEASAESEGEPPSFQRCLFLDNEFDWFSGASSLPSTDDCRFSGNSFDEGWARDSVAPGEESGGRGVSGETRGFLRYSHSSGLSFAYPASWELQELQGGSRAAILAPDGMSLAILLGAYSIPSGYEDPLRAKEVFDEARLALGKLLRQELGIELALEAEGEPYARGSLLTADFHGPASKEGGGSAQSRLRFIVLGDQVYALVGFQAESSPPGEAGELDAIFASIGAEGN